ncbi:hypothetical protein [Actinokineospora globicatena]|uniref:Glutathione synthase/RimK-type ligase, ATP-grasp superfamily n=1 Tax=Actinokineospora globicatena TaxID=103729 RepID=A0A9W6VDG0_9PSEU|nr:hypothetical protein [Actinokineospora globicatena]GLW94953.1 hypothetical protein Aglo03_57690 [Actinokineospora globicatena]
MSTLLLVTDLTYPARGRRYGDEDVFLGARLREHFVVALCHPKDAVGLMDRFDLVMVRNSGPVMHYPAEYGAFRAHALRQGSVVFNPLTGQGDMAGKQYLVDLTRAGFPVIPTVDRVADVDALPVVETYVVKPKAGADSVGLVRTDREGIPDGEGLLIQPAIDFDYEVSFYFVDHEFHYALYAPDPEKRWELRPYEPSTSDLAFAERFVRWNTLDHGIQRVDACRVGGDLLLVELEDLNPYLSLDLVAEEVREAFVQAVAASLRAMSGD